MYEGAPPQVPHDIAGLAITREENPCLECHLEAAELAPGHRATRIPASHRVDPRTGETGPEVAGARRMCVLCHVPQAGAPAPIGSTRRGAPR
jgi:nitrate reductase cytochrome c-type subunit